MVQKTPEHQIEADKVFEDTVMADEVKTTKVWAWDLVPKKKMSNACDDRPQESRHQRYARRKRALRAKQAADRAANSAAELNQELPASTTPPFHPTITTHPGSLEGGLLSGDQDEEMKEADVEVGLGSAHMTLAFRGKESN